MSHKDFNLFSVASVFSILFLIFATFQFISKFLRRLFFGFVYHVSVLEVDDEIFDQKKRTQTKRAHNKRKCTMQTKKKRINQTNK